MNKLQLRRSEPRILTSARRPAGAALVEAECASFHEAGLIGAAGGSTLEDEREGVLGKAGGRGVPGDDFGCQAGLFLRRRTGFSSLWFKLFR